MQKQLDDHRRIATPQNLRSPRHSLPSVARRRRFRLGLLCGSPQPDLDVELQRPDVEGETKTGRALLGIYLFGSKIGEGVIPTQATPYLNYLEAQVQSVGNAKFMGLLEGIQDGGDATIERCFSVLLDIAKIVKEVTRRDKSIHNILQSLLQLHGKSETSLSGVAMTACWQAIFMGLCWLTMTIQPSTDHDPHLFPVPLPACCVGTQKPRKVDDARRPIIKMLEAFGQLLPDMDTSKRSGQVSSLLYVSSLNFKSLVVFGRMKIEWTYVLSAHLQFHPSTRTLHIFRFPSVCAMSLSNGADSSILHSLFGEHFHENDSSNFLLGAWLQEILLSYRLLFGQDSSSRKHFLLQEKPRLFRADPAIFDPLLCTLCGQKKGKALLALGSNLWPRTCLDFQGQLQEQDMYDAKLDFPFLGERLLTIQTFNMRQQPSKIRDLWRDRRQPLQWYTFWLVLLLGGLSVVLTLVQCGISGAQLYFSIKPPR